VVWSGGTVRVLEDLKNLRINDEGDDAKNANGPNNPQQPLA
jgi:hypothetical protein